MTILADIEIDGDGWGEVPELEPTILAALEAAAAGCGVVLKPDAAVSVLLTDDARMRALNRQWRRLDKATNVLSFAALPRHRITAEARKTPFLGDIALGFGTVRAEALDEAKPFRDHVSHLIVHGFLHLVGFDHEDDAEAQIMEMLETRVLAGLGIPDPYGVIEPEPATARTAGTGR